jgi:hypothetical protein
MAVLINTVEYLPMFSVIFSSFELQTVTKV